MSLFSVDYHENIPQQDSVILDLSNEERKLVDGDITPRTRNKEARSLIV
jgi:hypothetical protein